MRRPNLAAVPLGYFLLHHLTVVWPVGGFAVGTAEVLFGGATAGSGISRNQKDVLWRCSAGKGSSEKGEILDFSEDEDQPSLVTKEMFLRALLAEDLTPTPPSPASSSSAAASTPTAPSDNAPVVKRERPSSSKKGKSTFKSYKVLDNRDSLPFAVQLATPDPYTHPELKRRRAAKVKKRSSAVEHSPLVASRLYAANNAECGGGGGGGGGGVTVPTTAETLLGEFQLDQHTTTGDVLQIGDVEYKVVKHRCLYKYAGGQRFVMVKKVLHVKEVGRVRAEEYLARQWLQSPPASSSLTD